MNRLFSCCSSFSFTRYTCFPKRTKYNSVESASLNKKFSCIKREINEHLLIKIWNTKDQNYKQRIIIRTIMKMNSQMKNEEASKKNTIMIHFETPSQTFSNSSENLKGRSEQLRGAISIQRPIRGEPGEVIWGFIPKEWVLFFVPITGYSGFYTLLVTLGTYSFSKEIYVCDHEYYNGISLAILCIYVVKTKGPLLAKTLDKGIDNYERKLNNWKEKTKQNLRNSILTEIKNKECMEGQQILVEAKRENVHLQREAEFRKRQMDVYENVTRILNYHVEYEKVRRSIQHKNLIQWVTKEVEKNLTSELKEKYMKLCMADIKEIFKKNEN